MAQTNLKLHKLQIRNKKGTEDQISHGAVTEVLLDGVPIKGCTFVKFEVKAKSITKVMIELLATVEVDANIPLIKQEDKPSDLKINGKPTVIHQIGNHQPAIGVKK